MSVRPGGRADLVSRGAGRLGWGVAAGLLVLGWLVTPPARHLVWALGAGLAGLFCVANAAGCGRVHCTFTGPLYLVLAGLWGLTLLGVRLVFDGVLWAAGTAGTLLAFIPEWRGRKYWGGAGEARGGCHEDC